MGHARPRRRFVDPRGPPLQRRLRDAVTAHLQVAPTGSLNLPYRYITQGRAEGDKPVTTPQRFARLLLNRPENLRDKDTALLRNSPKPAPS